MPVTLRLILATLLVLAGLILVVVAVLAARSRLRRNRWVGVRTPATLASEPQFVAGNRAAAMPVGAAGVVAIVGGAVLVGAATGALAWVILVLTLLGVLGLAAVGGLAGDRAATATPAPVPFSAGCSGACAGCDVIAGCRDAVATREAAE